MEVVDVHANLTTQHETHHDTTQTTISSIMQWDSSTQPQTQNH